jgi:anaerobic selenocysteine-containing dehydrogenase
MAYKRQIDRLPIVPKDAKEFNVTCHYCIVGCGYKAYTWPTHEQGGTAPDQNKFGVDLSRQQPPETAAWYAPAMYNIVRQNGEDVHIVIKPDTDCVVNSGLGSVRGARMAEMSYSQARNTQLQRLTDPMVWRYGQMQPTSWDDALDLVARVTVGVINTMGEDGLIVSAFDHGGAGGGYENTWGTGKLYFGAMKVRNIRIHNRPAYNSEVHATRDMGVGELNNCYEDAELADTIVAVGTNALETQTNYFLNHWVSNLRGTRRRTMFAYEKGLIWGNDNYRTNGALVNVALATGNIGRPGGGCVRMGGHQEGYSRPDYPGPRPAFYVDQILIEGKGGVHHIWGCDHYKTTLNALKFKQVYKKRTDIVKDAMSAVPYGDRTAMVTAILDAIKNGGLFAVDTDIVPTKIGQACHVWLPAATSGEANLTSMNGERRMRLTERYMDPPGQAMPDCLIAARIANNMERVLREQGKAQYADQFKGFDWKTEEDAFMDGYHGHEKGGQFVTYERLRAMGTNGFQEPAVDFKDGKIIGTKRLFADGKFGGKDGKATFMETKWRGLEAPGKEAEMKKWPFLINNGRTNIVWQSAYLDQENEFVMDRMPYPLIQMNPQDMTELNIKQGDLVEVYNDNGSTQAMAYPTPTAKPKQAFMLFANPNGVQGNVVSPGVNELVIPNYKQTWAGIRKIANAPDAVRNLSFKSQEYAVG